MATPKRHIELARCFRVELTAGAAATATVPDRPNITMNTGTAASPGPLSERELRSMILPARLNAEQTAAVLGFQSHDIPSLVAAGLLTPLGRIKKGKNTVKYFSMIEVLDKRSDPKWLSRATDAAYERFLRDRPPSDDSQASGRG